VTEKINENTDLTGRVVRLKSGGPLMTAASRHEGRWWCRWFSGEGEPHLWSFDAHELELYEPAPSPVPGPSGASS
jgi:uncharacterized protein YodC (DUF2158 family)